MSNVYLTVLNTKMLKFGGFVKSLAPSDGASTRAKCPPYLQVCMYPSFAITARICV